ncbi:B- and T-lymphocyte attenuator isoform X1 [Pimephales promelas]|uniref:B- and T-lymphocyte attenuator isoform X1 n=1 Tax=Pimephales promelas TaxID=90988 RepID=UPI00195558D8|nr:B- and T-lymphocyte attenuator isoform X1 [Pimephales promelas]
MDCLYLRKKALLLDVFVVFILHVNTNTQGHASQCPVFRVPRGAVHKVCTNKPFKISCNLKNCRGQTNNITWTKETLKGWIPVSGGQMSSSQIYSASDLLTSYLTFINISKNHDGLYRCELRLSNSSTVSHYINISVSVSSTNDSLGDEMSCPEKGDNSETNTDTSFNSNPWWLPYLFICMGVVIPILILMLIFILCINGCTTLRRRKTQKAHVQYTASVLSSPSPRVQKNNKFVGVQYSEERHQHSRDSNTCSLTSPPAQSTSHLSDCGGDDSLSNRRVNSSSQVVYASLHHLTPTPSSTAPRPTREDFSEYAAIRVS